MCGATALHTGIYSTVKFLRKASAETSDTRRQALILFTDGADTASSLTMDDVLKEVTNLEIPIYAFHLRFTGSSGDTLQTDDFLTPLTAKTGGRYETIALAIDLAPWYRRIADELRSQYSIGYAASNPSHNGLWRPIQVSVGRQGYAIRHKEGYYAPCDPDQPCAQKKR
jgi:Ca-activated chloride channel family protein